MGGVGGWGGGGGGGGLVSISDKTYERTIWHRLESSRLLFRVF